LARGQWRKRKLASLEEQFKETPQKDYWVTKSGVM